MKHSFKHLALTTALMTPAFVYAQNVSADPAAVADAEYHANWGLDMINALPAYIKGYTGKGIVVAVVDTGLDVDHPEYAGRVSPFLYNFGDDQDIDNVFPGFNPNGSLDGHGNHVAGIIGAGRNGFGMQGVAYDAVLMPLRAVGVNGRDEGLVPVNHAIVHAVEHGAKVINGSYGPNSFPSPEFEDGTANPNYQVLDYQLIPQSPEDLIQTYEVLKYAADSDVVLVFAAGNERQDQPGAYTAIPSGNGMLPLITRDYINSGKIRFFDEDDENIEHENPSTYSFLDPNDPVFDDMNFSDLKGSLIAVVSVGPDGNLAPYSNECGETAEWCIAAPGGVMSYNEEEGIYSTWPHGDTVNGNVEYRYLQGTSMASPHVAGAAAVVRSAFPYMSARQTIETILTTASTNGYADQDKFGQGLLNLGAAVDGPMEFRYTGVFDVDTQGYSSVWSNSISGAGDLTKRGDGVLVLTGHNTYQGPTSIVGGSLEINGSITSVTDVSQSGQVTGIGTVGSLTLAKGGKISPGSAIDAEHAIGTLTVNGSFTQQSGSAYVAGLAIGAGADKIVINGAAQLDSDASLELVRENAGRGNATARYTLLTASNGISGTYGVLNGSLATQTPFIDIVLDYDANNVFLNTDRSNVAFTDVAITPNQLATASALESQREGGVLYDHMLFLSEAEARQAYDQLSGEAYATVQSALINSSAYTRTAVYDQLSNSFVKNADVSETYAIQPHFWMHGFTGWVKHSGNNNAAATKTSSSGFLAGIDLLGFDNWRFGALAGYSHTNFHLNKHMSSGTSDDYTIGTYGGSETALAQGTLAFRSGLAYTWHNIEMKRSVAFAGFDDKLTADYKADTFQVFGELGYKHQPTALLSIEPYANLAYVHLRTDAFNEKDYNSASLNVHKSSMGTALSSIGFRATADLSQSIVPVKAHADFAWRHAFSDATPVSKAHFNGSDVFAINGTTISRNTASISAGLDYQLKKNTVLDISYQGQFGSGITQNGLNANFKIKF